MSRLFLHTSLITLLFFAISSGIKAQNVENQYEILTKRWMEVSEQLKSYDGLSRFCQSPEFRKHTTNILSDLHHFDSVMIDFLQEPTTELLIGEKEYRKTLREIEEFEENYSNKAFISFLRKGCLNRNELERNKEELINDYTTNSFDGQVLILERGLEKYLKHIDKRILAIEKHIHVIHPDRLGFQLFSDGSF